MPRKVDCSFTADSISASSCASRSAAARASAAAAAAFSASAAASFAAARFPLVVSTAFFRRIMLCTFVAAAARRSASSSGLRPATGAGAASSSSAASATVSGMASPGPPPPSIGGSSAVSARPRPPVVELVDAVSSESRGASMTDSPATASGGVYPDMIDEDGLRSPYRSHVFWIDGGPSFLSSFAIVASRNSSANLSARTARGTAFDQIASHMFISPPYPKSIVNACLPTCRSTVAGGADGSAHGRSSVTSRRSNHPLGRTPEFLPMGARS